jgi:hypothetical protein
MVMAVMATVVRLRKRGCGKQQDHGKQQSRFHDVNHSEQ